MNNTEDHEVEGHDSDICECGDFRLQHRHGNDGTRCFCGCSTFRFAHKADARDLAIFDRTRSGNRRIWRDGGRDEQH